MSLMVLLLKNLGSEINHYHIGFYSIIACYTLPMTSAFYTGVLYKRWNTGDPLRS